ncbi:MAG: hypothetical protein AABY27_06055 [Pseudomonadota bacterium]
MNLKYKEALENIKNEINQEYGFQGNIPSINYGPCGIFAKIFYNEWNSIFPQNKCHICFVMTLDRSECDHIVIRLPSKELYDGGIGIHNEDKYIEKFIIDEMFDYAEDLLEKWSYGLNRTYPRFCPNFNQYFVEKIIRKHLVF